MCEWGTEIELRVPISARKSYTGKFRWDTKKIDSCLADIVQVLNDAGIYTAECCCGHGNCDGYLALHDGRVFLIPQDGILYWQRPDDRLSTVELENSKLKLQLAKLKEANNKPQLPTETSNK